MYPKLLVMLLCTLTLTSSFAQQSWSEIKGNTSEYLTGEGMGATIEEADQDAINDLIGKISLQVSSEFASEMTEEERMSNGKSNVTANSYVTQKIKTFSSATLTNTERIIIDNDPDNPRVGRYIERTEIAKIFEGRIATLQENIRLGEMAESKVKLDDALRNYYWAYILLLSCQHPASVKYTSEETGKQMQPLTWLPSKLGELFSDIKIEVQSRTTTDVELLFTYNGKKVSSLDFKYYDGRDWSNLCSVKDGIGTMEFIENMMPDNVQIEYEYAYRNQAHLNPEVKNVLGVIKTKAMPKSRIPFSIKASDSSVGQTATQTSTIRANQSIVTNAKAEVRNGIEYINSSEHQKIIDEVVSAIRLKNYDVALPYFTTEGEDIYKRLIKYGKAKILNAQNCTFYKYGDCVVARSVKMSFSPRNSLRQNFVEDIVFTFNADKKIECLAFGLDEMAQKDIMSKTVWPETARMALMEFLENYKTAYALKRLDYIKSIFDDNAIIIVGKVTKTARPNSTDSQAYTMDTKVRRTLLSKDEFISRLGVSFRSNEFINIRFANNDVRKAAKGEIYGIQIKQDYYSTNYGDEGYLYLQVDISNPKEPNIFVRTWQDKPDPEIGLFGLGDF